VGKNINDKSRERAIVMHGASYYSKEFIRKYGPLERSLRCPALPELMSASIIKTKLHSKIRLFIRCRSCTQIWQVEYSGYTRRILIR
jgi:hypothetical protein